VTLGHKIGRDTIIRYENPWKEKTRRADGVACFIVSYEIVGSTSKGRFWGISMTNRIMSTLLTAAMAFCFGMATEASAQMKPKKEPTAGQMAARERMSKCSAEWKEAKSGGKVEPGMKWPKFWSACNARMKGRNV
jgi:hypothetical protein